MRTRLVAAVLLAFALRAIIPLGFMPASDGSLSLMICPGGLAPGILPAGKVGSMPGGMGMPGHPGHGQRVTDDGYCIFTTAFSAAPPPPFLATLFLLLAVIAIVSVALPAPPGIRLVHLPQARAPPAPL